MVVPYIKGFSKGFINVHGKVKIQFRFKRGYNIKNHLETPKNRDSAKYSNL